MSYQIAQYSVVDMVICCCGMQLITDNICRWSGDRGTRLECGFVLVAMLSLYTTSSLRCTAALLTCSWLVLRWRLCQMLLCMSMLCGPPLRRCIVLLASSRVCPSVPCPPLTWKLKSITHVGRVTGSSCSCRECVCISFILVASMSWVCYCVSMYMCVFMCSCLWMS